MAIIYPWDYYLIRCSEGMMVTYEDKPWRQTHTPLEVYPSLATASLYEAIEEHSGGR